MLNLSKKLLETVIVAKKIKWSLLKKDMIELIDVDTVIYYFPFWNAPKNCFEWTFGY